MTVESSALNVAALRRVPFVGCKLDLNTKVYRITDFYSVAQMLDTSRLRLACMNDYDDRNEGIDRLVSQYVLSAYGRGLGPFGVNDSRSAAQQIEMERRNRFISCWSTTAESHAMWAMYSPEKCAVKMQTTIGKLLSVAGGALVDSWRIVDDPTVDLAAEPRPMVCEADVLPVRYEDVHKLLPKLARRTGLARRLVNPNKPLNTGTIPKSILRMHERWARVFGGSILKDVSYSYESEIRICIRLGWEPSLANQRDLLGSSVDPLIEGASLSIDDQYATVIKGSLKLAQNLRREHVPKDFMLNLPSNFIESVCIDPRAAKHKLTFMEGYFKGRGVLTERSSSFDSVCLELQEYPDGTR